MEKIINFIFETLFNQKAIFWAVENNQISMLKFFIYIGMNTSITNAYGQTLLDFAIQKNNKEAVEILANLSTNNNIFNDILLKAARLGNEDIVSYVLDKGASVNYFDLSNNNTALELSAIGGYKSIVDKLVIKAKELGEKIVNGDKALLQAAKEGHKDIVKIFIDYSENFDPCLKIDIFGEALKEAVRGGHLDIFKMLIDKYPSLLNLKTDFINQLLILAVESNNLDVVRALVDEYKKLDKENKGGFLNKNSNFSDNALIHAVTLGYAKIVRELLEDKENLYLKDKNGETLLIIAAKKSHSEVVSVLINKCEELDKSRKEDFLNQIDGTGKAAFNYAAQKGDIEVSKILIKAGAKVDIEDGNQIKPINLTNGYIADRIIRRLNGR